MSKKRNSYFCIVYKTAMALNKRRQRYAQILLAVFITMLIAVSLHCHHDDAMAEDACVECVHHVPHDGHLSSQSLSVDECLLCQLGVIPYLLPSLTIVNVLQIMRKTVFATATVSILKRETSCISLRAPPAFLA